MHFDREKPKFQVRLLEFEKDGITFKRNSKNRNIYPNKDNLTIKEMWKRIEVVIENKIKPKLKKDKKK